MAYAIKVMVVERKTNKGLSGMRVKTYGGSEVKTNANGMATLVAQNSTVTVYVEGSTAYDGSASSAPNPIIVTRG